MKAPLPSLLALFEDHFGMLRHARKGLDGSWRDVCSAVADFDDRMASEVLESLNPWVEQEVCWESTLPSPWVASTWKRTLAAFLQAAAEGSDGSAQRLQTAVDAFGVFDAFDDPELLDFRARLMRVVARPSIAAACRSVVDAIPQSRAKAPWESFRQGIFAALVMEGTTSSIGVLTDLLGRTPETPFDVGSLAGLGVFATTTEAHSFVAEASAKLRSGRRSSEVVRLAKRLGLRSHGRVIFEVRMASSSDDTMLELRLDSEYEFPAQEPMSRPADGPRGSFALCGSRPAFRVVIRSSGQVAKSFPRLPTQSASKVEQLPDYLRQLETECDVTWDFTSLTCVPLDPRGVARLARWLSGAQPNPS